MGSQVVSFLRRSVRTADWTREELAELYRIEHALAQANVRLDTDRGLTDEGDPWFVFCRVDGEILVHISRFDGQYRLYSPGLSNPLVGHSFAELAKSFTKIVPMQVSLERRDGAQLFVHPAAMLAVIVGTLFVAADDLHLFAARGESDHHAHSADDIASAGGRNSLKFVLQAAFDSYINTFLSSLREAAANEKSYYLTLISTVTAFVLETTLQTSDQLPSAVIADNSALVEDSSTQDGSSVPPGIAAHDDISSSKSAIDGSKAQQALEMTAQQLSEKDGQADNAQQNGIADGLNKLLHANDQTAMQFRQGDAIQLHQEDSAPPMKLVDAGPSDSSAVEGTGYLLKWASLNGSAGIPELSGASISAPASGNSISSMLLGEASSGNSDIGLLLSHALTVAAFSPAQDPVLTSILVNSYQQKSDTVVMASAPAAPAAPDAATMILPTTSSGATQYPIYDHAAQATLETFLKANPQAEVIFYQNNMIVYDGVQVSPSPIVVKVWEFEAGGSTITIVGHADHGLVAT
jgi:hypothetical protein